MSNISGDVFPKPSDVSKGINCCINVVNDKKHTDVVLKCTEILEVIKYHLNGIANGSYDTNVIIRADKKDSLFKTYKKHFEYTLNIFIDEKIGASLTIYDIDYLQKYLQRQGYYMAKDIFKDMYHYSIVLGWNDVEETPR